MSPPPSSRAQARRQRSLVVSLVVVVVIALGWLAGVVAAGWTPKLGLDLAGGFSVVYQPQHKVSTGDLNEAVDILNSRVNQLGVSGATVETQGGEIVVSVPGVKNAQAVLATIGETAQLYFRPVLCGAPAYSAPHGTTTTTPPGSLPTSCPSQYQLVTSNLSGSSSSGNGVYYDVAPYPALANHKSTAPDNDDPTKTVLLPGLSGAGIYKRYLLGPAGVKGNAVKKALAQQSQTGAWVVNVTLTGAGSTEWDHMTQTYFHEMIGIELDGVVQSAPITQPQQSTWSSFDGQVEISGSFTEGQAQHLAQALNFGALPVRLDKLTTQTVSPTLGHSALVAGLGAGLVGLLLVLFYVLGYYRLLGLVVISGLALTGALLWAIISSLGHTSISPSFDLAGLTGVIVSIGITVDSYIVYFERLKDETRSGRSVRTSVDRGFKSAWRTVLAADLVSLAAAVILYLIAVSTVRGFAFFLGLSTLLDMLVTYFFTRPLVILLGRNERLVRARGFGISKGLALAEADTPESAVVGNGSGNGSANGRPRAGVAGRGGRRRPS